MSSEQFEIAKGGCKKDRPFFVALSIVLMFSFGSIEKLEKHIFKNVKNIFNV